MEFRNPTCWGVRSSSANVLLLVLLAMNLPLHVSAARFFGNETDRLALLEFKHQISDDPHGLLNSWNHSQHHCQWQGVTCHPRHQRVTGLILSGDFGLARLLPKTINTTSEEGISSTSSIRGSIGYAAPEYGLGHQVSTQGDVYAYGILLLEMFIGRRPTDDMFKDGLDLHNYVKRALPEHVLMIIDPSLLSSGDNNGEVTTQLELCNDDKRMQCVALIFEIGIKCSTALPDDRMPMDEIERKLHHIKDRFLGTKMNTTDLDV